MGRLVMMVRRSRLMLRCREMQSERGIMYNMRSSGKKLYSRIVAKHKVYLENLSLLLSIHHYQF